MPILDPHSIRFRFLNFHFMRFHVLDLHSLHFHDFVRFSILLLCMACIVHAQSAHAFANDPPFPGGSGTADDPFVIETVQELQMVKDYPNAHFMLGADIDADETSGWNGNLGFEPIGYFVSLFDMDNEPFHGSLDGNGYVIENLTINRPEEAGVGLFRVLGTQARITGLHLKNANITGDNVVGVIAAQSAAHIKDSKVSGDVSGSTYVGLLAGVNSNKIIRSETSGTLSAIFVAGGITGGNYNEIVESSTSVEIRETENEADLAAYFGGIAGFNLEGRIHKSFAEGEITTRSPLAGGIAGVNLTGESYVRQAVISRSHASVALQGEDRIGGLVGWNTTASKIIDSSSDGSVEGAVAIGGLVGNNSQAAEIIRSYASGDVTGQGSVGGLAGFSIGVISDSYASGAVSGGMDFGTGGLVGTYTFAMFKAAESTASSNMESAGGSGMVPREDKGLMANPEALANPEARSISQVPSNPEALAYPGTLANPGVRAYPNAMPYPEARSNPESAVSDGNHSYPSIQSQEDQILTAIIRSYSTGEVTGDNQLGGLAGLNHQNGTIQDSYWDTESSGMTNGVGQGLNEGLTGLTTGQMTGQNAIVNMPGLSFEPDGPWQSIENAYPGLIHPDLPSPAYALQLAGPRNLASSETGSEPFTLSVVDEQGHPAPVQTTTRFKLESSQDGTFYSLNGEQVEELGSLHWGRSEGNFFYKGDHNGLHNIKATFYDGDDALAGQSVEFTVRVNHPRVYDWRLFPNQGGNQGRTLVTLTGDDFNEQMEAVLTADGIPDIPGEIVEVFEGSHSMDLRFDLTGQEPGTRALKLTHDDGSVQILEEAFHVVEANELVPQLWTSIQGMDNLESGSTSTVNIHYGNNGEMDLHDILLYIRIPKGLDFSIYEQDFAIPDMPEAMGTEHFDDEGELASFVPFFETEDLVVFPLWIYQIRAGQSQTIRLEVETGSVPITQQLSEIYGGPISVEILALPPETNPFTLSGDFENSEPELLFLYIDTVVMDALAEEGMLKAPSSAESGNLNPRHQEGTRGSMSALEKELSNRLNLVSSGPCVENENYTPPDNDYVTGTRRRVANDMRNHSALPSGGDYARGVALGFLATVACASNPVGWKTCGVLALAAGADNIRTFSNLFDAYDNLGEPDCEPPGDDEDYDPPVCDGCGGGGSTYGDPHIITYDGMGYGFHAVGEFILTRALEDDFEIQARMEQMRDDIRHFSINTAFAINVNGDHVVFEQSGNVGSNIVVLPELYINQSEHELPADGPESINLPNGGSIIRRGQTLTVRWPDNRARVDVWQSNARPVVGNRALGIEITLSDRYDSKVEGLLGSNSGAKNTAFVTRDGTRLAGPLTFDDLYRTFGDSWRITQDESLFGTTTFADYSMPDGQKTLESLDAQERDAAEAVCLNQGITHPTLLNNCMFDVAFSGEPGFAFDSSRLVIQAPEREPEALLADHEGRIQVTLRSAKAEGVAFSFQVTDQNMAFELMDDGDDSSLSDSRVLYPLDPGTYNISMEAPSDQWSLLDASCNIPDDRFEVSWDDFLITLELLEGESAVCSFDVIPDGLLVPFALQAPQHEDLIVVEGSGTDEIALVWESATEKEPGNIMYTWMLDSSSDFSEPLMESKSDDDGSHTGLTLTFGQVNAFLSEQDIAMDEIFSGYWTVEASYEGLAVWADEPRGISFQRGLVTAGISEPETPESYKLGQNYPNPFNPATNITFEIPNDTHVRLDVYNILGQHVKTLVDRSKTAGRYHVVLDASAMASGVYIYRLSTDDFLQSRTMTVIK